MAIQPFHGPMGLIQLEGRGDPWANIGGALGTGIGQGLQALAENKMAEIMQRKAFQQAEHTRQQQMQQAVPYLQSQGASQQEAINFLNLPEHIQKAELNKANGVQFRGNQPNPQEAMQQQQQQQQAFQQEQALQRQQAPPPEITPEQVVPQTGGPSTNIQNPVAPGYSQRQANKILNDYAASQMLKAYSDIKNQHAQLKQQVKKQFTPAPIQAMEQQKQQIKVMQQQLPKPTPMNVGSLGGNEAKRIAQEKLDVERYKVNDKHDKALWDFNGKEYKESQAAKVAAEDTLMNTQTMKEATQSGENDPQWLLSFLKGLGVEDYEGFLRGNIPDH